MKITVKQLLEDLQNAIDDGYGDCTVYMQANNNSVTAVSNIDLGEQLSNNTARVLACSEFDELDNNISKIAFFIV